MTFTPKKILIALGLLSVFVVGGIHGVRAATISSTVPGSVTSGLVGWWTMDGTDMLNGAALDKSGNGNSAALVNIATSTFYRAGKIGQAFNFDGVNDYLLVPSSSSLPAEQPMSISVWVKPDNATAGFVLASRPFSGNGWNITYAFGNRLMFQHDGVGDLSARTTFNFGAFSTTQWTHLVVTWDGTTDATHVLIYKNGVIQAHDTDTNGSSMTSTSGQPLYITSDQGGGGFFKGSMDDFRMYDRVLSTTEISQIYAAGLATGKQAASPQVTGTTSCSTGLSCGLVGYWTFDGKDTPWTSATAATTLDKSGSGNTGTLTSMNQSKAPVQGKIGQGLKFDGVDDIVSTQNPALLSSGAVTVCAWINPLAWTNAQGLHFIISDSKFNFAAYKTSTDTRLYFTSNGSSRAFSATNSIDLNKWQHACVMRDISGRANIFVNGSLSGGADQNSGVPTPSGGWTTVIGANASKSDYFFDGLLDDVRVYGRVLSSEEIFSLAGNSVVSSGSGVDNQNQIETSSPNSPAEPASPIITDGKTLTVSKSGTGQGTITATGINCGNDCSEIYTTNSWIVLTPITPSGYGFAKWRGGVCETVDSANKCTVIMRNNLTVTPIFGILPTRSGNTLNAASCEMSDVQVAVNEARDGDIIKVPAGTCTWTTSLEIGSYSYASQKNTSKALTLEGAGADSTTIIDAIIPIANKVNSALIIYVESGKFVRVTGFSFDGTNSVKGYGALSISGPRGTGEVLFRIDHNAFPNLTYKGITVTSVYGLIDSNTFTPLYPYGTNGVSINGDDYSGRTSNISWSRAQQLGSDKAVYMENNKFLNSVSANGAFDAYTGARYVFRYNDVVGTHVGHHGFDSSVRGAVDFEIYNNTFSNPADALHRQAPLLVMAFRSGSGVVFNNFVTPPVGNPNLSGYSAFAALQSYRSLDFYKDTPEFICDGDSPWDGNSPDILDLNDNGLFDSGDQSSGYPCKDQIGRTGGFDAKGYQTLSPVYSWNNNFNGNIGGHLAVDDRWIPNHIIATRHILQGRDYFNGIPKPGYVPYSCPHPLTNLLGGCDSTKAGVSGYNIQGMSKSLPVVTTSDHSLPPHQITPTSTPLTGDFNHDGLVNTLDFSLLVSSWNQPSTTYDLNGDGLVNTLDYAIMAQHWSR